MKIVMEMPWGKNLSVNHMRFGKGGMWHRKPDVQGWMEVLAYYVKTGLRRREIKLPIEIKVDFRYPDNRKRDSHNYAKVICDAVALGLGIDDTDIRISTGSIAMDRENPGFTITIMDEEEE